MRRAIALLLTLGCCGCAALQSGIKDAGGRVLSVVSSDAPRGKVFEVQDTARSLTQEEEHFLGRAVAARILTLYKPAAGAAVNQYLNRVGAVVGAHSGRPTTFGGYHFKALESSDLNSFAAPGGFIFITTGLLKRLQSEEALAGVLAHEVAHVELRHGISAIQPSNLARALNVAGKAASVLNCAEQVGQLGVAFEGAINDVVEKIIEKGYSREQEYEADARAVVIASTAGYDAAALGRLVSALQDEIGAKSGGLFGSHPHPQDRVTALQGVELPRQVSQSAVALRSKRFARALSHIN